MTTTTDIHPTLQEVFNNLPAPEGLAKIVMQNLRDERGVVIGAAIARADDGMIIGAAQNGVVQFGHDPVFTRYFITPQHATDYAKRLCRMYLGRTDIDFETAEGPIQLATPGPQTQRRRM